MSDSKVVLVGGNGFVGTVVAELLVERGITPVCVSRSGTKPSHLEQKAWAEKAEWRKGDATLPDPAIFEDAAALVCLVGSPPVPTFSGEAYANQLAANSQPNLGAIAAANAAGVLQLVVLGAHLPKLLQTDRFAYAKGKRLCLEAARDFAQTSEKQGAVVLQPTAIYGTRHSVTGKPTNIATLMRPISKIQSMMPNGIKQVAPEQLVSVSAVANAVISACLEEKYRGHFSIMSNQQIIDG